MNAVQIGYHRFDVRAEGALRFQAARGAIQWHPHPVWGDKVLVPSSIPGITPKRLAQFDPFTYRSRQEMERLLRAQILFGKYYNDIQCPGLGAEIYEAMDF